MSKFPRTIADTKADRFTQRVYNQEIKCCINIDYTLNTCRYMIWENYRHARRLYKFAIRTKRITFIEQFAVVTRQKDWIFFNENHLIYLRNQIATVLSYTPEQVERKSFTKLITVFSQMNRSIIDNLMDSGDCLSIMNERRRSSIWFLDYSNTGEQVFDLNSTQEESNQRSVCFHCRSWPSRAWIASSRRKCDTMLVEGRGGLSEGRGIRNYWLGVHRALFPFPPSTTMAQVRRLRYHSLETSPKHRDAHEYRSCGSIKMPRPAVLLVTARWTNPWKRNDPSNFVRFWTKRRLSICSPFKYA